jgi:predicted GNAT superfamily acetyltransferase
MLNARHSRSYAPEGLHVFRGAGENFKPGDYWMVGNDHGYAEVQLMKKRNSYHSDTFYIEHIVINNLDRGKGHGRKLYLLLEEMARLLGCRWIQIDSEQETTGFWMKMGYQEIPKVYYKGKKAMVKQLDP